MNKKNQTVLDKFYLKNEKKINKYSMDKYLFKQLNYKSFIEINKIIKERFGTSVILYDLFSIFCDNENSTCHSIDDNNKKIFYDYGHLTLDGSKYIGNILFDSKFHENYLK